MAEANGVHVHRLDEFHVLNVLRLGECATGLGAERVSVDTLDDDFLPVDEESVFFAAINMSGIFDVLQSCILVAVTVFDGAEAKTLALDVQRAALRVFQRKHGGVEIRCLSVPQTRAFHSEVYA